MENYYEPVFWTGSIFTFLLQVYVLYLVTFASTPEMREYTYFLKLLMGCELLFNLSFGIFLSPHPIAPAVGFETNGLAKYFGFTFCKLCLAVMGYAMVMIVVAQLLCLIHRYSIFATSNNFHRGLMSTQCKLAVQLVVQSLAIGLGVLFYKILWTEEHMLRMDRFPVIIDTGTPISTVFYSCIAFVFVSVQITSFVLLYLTLKKLRKNVASMTPETYRLYWQFTILLGAQLMTPLIFICGPTGVWMIAMLSDARNTTDFQVQIGLLGLLLYGLVNSLLTVMFVTPFRRHAARMFVYWWLNPLLRCLKLGNPNAVQEIQAVSTAIRHTLEVAPM